MSLVKLPASTPARIAANRANAKKSTGPRTPEGKRRIVFNALKHGQRSRDFLSNLRKGASRDDKMAYLESLSQAGTADPAGYGGGSGEAGGTGSGTVCTQRLLSQRLNRPPGKASPSKPTSPLDSEIRRISTRSGIEIVVPWGRITLHLCLRRGRGPNRQGTRWPRRATGGDGNRRRNRVYWTARIYRHKARSAEAWLASQGAPSTLWAGQTGARSEGQAGVGSQE